MLTREDIAFMYLEQLPFEPYPFQEQAILDWFSSDPATGGGGTLVCAPTGMGKTLIAEAGIYETMKTGKKAYYTTPLSNDGDTANITSDSLPVIDDLVLRSRLT
jgi:superfamily II RNA helicase